MSRKSWKEYTFGIRMWDFPTNFSPVKKPEQTSNEKDFKWVGHSKCKQNIQVPKIAKRGERYCPNCKELF